MQELDGNTVTFSLTDCEGTLHEKTFQARTWPKTLDQLIPFLTGAGFSVPEGSVTINLPLQPDVTGEDLFYVDYLEYKPSHDLYTEGECD